MIVLVFLIVDQLIRGRFISWMLLFLMFAPPRSTLLPKQAQAKQKAKPKAILGKFAKNSKVKPSKDEAAAPEGGLPAMPKAKASAKRYVQFICK